MTVEANDIIVKIENLSKSYPGVQALDAINFQIVRGEIHALVGENGAGKSTLINILSGITHRNNGNIYFNGRGVELNSPAEARGLGIATVHQELSLAEHLSVAENVFLGRLPTKSNIFVDWASMNLKCNELFSELKVEIKPNTKLGDLPLSSRQVVEIVRALSMDAQLLILDEPTSVLTENEREILFTTVRKLQNRGVTVILISHWLDEVFTLAQRITVLRDGRCVGTYRKDETTRDQVVQAMIGRSLAQRNERTTRKPGKTLLSLVGFSIDDCKVSNINLDVRSGEVVTLAGLVGSGRSEFVEGLFGIRKKSAGKVYVRGEAKEIRNPTDARKLGIGLLPEDRKNKGLFLIRNVQENITLTSLHKITKYGLIQHTIEVDFVKKYIDALDIRGASPNKIVRNLSGGNQQKVALARWLAAECEILIIDEPTRGVDVGAKQEIYQLIDEMVAEGKGVLLVSSELPEVLAMSDRIFVMSKGKIAGELEGSKATSSSVMKLAGL